MPQNVAFFGKFADRRLFTLQFNRGDEVFREAFVPLVHQHAELDSGVLIAGSKLGLGDIFGDFRDVVLQVEAFKLLKESLAIIIAA